MNNSNVTAAVMSWMNPEYLSDVCTPIAVCMSLLNFLMNSTLIYILITLIRKTPRPEHCLIQLLFLAISDLSIGIFFVVGALWLPFLSADLQQDADPSPDLRFLFYFFISNNYVNRALTVYITLMRTLGVFNVQVALVLRAKSTNYTIAHVFLWAILPAVGLFLTSTLFLDLLVDQEIIKRRLGDRISLSLGGAFFGLVNLAMPVMGILLLIKIRSGQRFLNRVELDMELANRRGDDEEATTERASRRTRSSEDEWRSQNSHVFHHHFHSIPSHHYHSHQDIDDNDGGEIEKEAQRSDGAHGRAVRAISVERGKGRAGSQTVGSRDHGSCPIFVY